MTRYVGRYEVLEELGAGGMGVVYRARDRNTNQTVALKQLLASPAEANNKAREALLEREYHSLVRLKHPRIIEVYDYGLGEQGPWYTMELLGGADLQQLSPLPFRKACEHLRDVASSLALMHSHRLLHRDVTPRNVRLTADGRAKLIDFGALSSFGTSSQIFGTPPCMAPEVLRQLPLDQRTDLFALGAVAYWALTGRHAYPARRAQELWTLWQTPPPRPSLFAQDIPPELDRLVLSLLSLDALARPPSAAQVIDELTAIGGLEPEELDHTGESYLSSGPLVGREEELSWLRQRVLRPADGASGDGRGASVLIEGGPGMGKTRLLREIGLDAQLKGALVLRVDAQTNVSPFGVASALAVQLLDALPELAGAAARPVAQVLAHLSDDLADRLKTDSREELSEDPGERRARFQSALYDWFAQVVAEQALVLAVDNVQAADDNSAAFLAALSHSAHQTRMAIVLTQRTGEPIAAPIPVRTLRKQSSCLKLSALSHPACEELVGALFGRAANTVRFANLLFDKSAGNPQHCMDLAALAIKRGIVKYVGGGWVLPHDVAEGELPSRVEELLDEKLLALSPAARDLFEILSVYGKPTQLERCLTLLPLDKQTVYSSLNELVAEHLLAADGSNYTFPHAAMREAVLGRIDAARCKELNLRVASALLAEGGTDVQTRMDAAWSLLKGGESQRGADLITVAAREFLQHQGVEDAEQVVRAIDAAIQVYEREGRSKYEIARLLFPLLSLAFFVDWRVTLKHGERAIDLGLDITGLGLAGRLSRFLPGKLALGIGLAVAFLRFSVRQALGLRYNLIEAIEGFCGLIPASIGTQNIVFDLPAVERFMTKLKPLTLFGEKHIATLMYDFAQSQYLMSFALEDDARVVLEKLDRDFQDPAIRKVLGEAHWKAMYGGILFSLGILYPYEFGPHSLEIADKMEGVGLRVWSMAAEEVRMLYHAFRGESQEVQRYRERVELYAVQGSTNWQVEIFWPILLMPTEILCGNTVGVRTIREQLTRRAKDHASLELYAHVAQATHMVMRGEYTVAIALYERILERVQIESPSDTWPAIRACSGYGTALNAIGEHARAKEYYADVLARAGAQVERVVGHYLEPERNLALSEAGLGNFAEAVRISDALLAKHGAQDQPMLVGLLHKTRAEIALMMKDSATFDHHVAEMDQRFRSARNPGLIAQGATLIASALRSGLETGAPDNQQSSLHAPRRVVSAAARKTLAAVATSANRYQAAVTAITHESGAKSGQLFLLREGQLELSASTVDEPPPQAEVELLRREVTRAKHLALETSVVASAEGLLEGDDVTRSVFVDSSPPVASSSSSSSFQQSAYGIFALSASLGGQAVVVGGVVLKLDPQRMLNVDLDYLEAIASVLHDGAGYTTNSQMLESAS